MCTLSTQSIKFIFAAMLLIHGLGHGGALGALLWIKHYPGTDTGGWLAAKSWLLPSLSPAIATGIAVVLWIFSLVGFVAAGLSFLGIIWPGEIWRQAAMVSATISTLGIVLFFGTWPMFNTLAALAVNLAVFITQLWLKWPPSSMFVNSIWVI